MTDSTAAVHQVRFGTSTGRIVLAVTIVASGMAFLDGTIVNVALPRIEADLGGGLSTLQWVLNSYMLTLGALVLVGGSLGDLLGIRRVFTWGVIGFAITSLMCAVAPSAEALIAARALQGVSAALMVPGSLALISSLFIPEQRGRAIGCGPACPVWRQPWAPSSAGSSWMRMPPGGGGHSSSNSP